MWVNSILGYGADILLSFYAVYLFFCYFDIFFKRKKDKRLSVIGLVVFVLWQMGISTIINFPVYVNIVVTIIVTWFAVLIVYEGMWWNKCVFVIAFNAIWMFMETLCNYILMIYCEKYAYVQPLGSLISKTFIVKVKGELGQLVPILAVIEEGSAQDIFSVLEAGIFDYIEVTDNLQKYAKKIEELFLWGWYLRKYEFLEKRGCREIDNLKQEQ